MKQMSCTVLSNRSIKVNEKNKNTSQIVLKVFLHTQSNIVEEKVMVKDQIPCHSLFAMKEHVSIGLNV